MYHVYQIDFDRSNEREQTDGNFDQKNQFQIHEVFNYCDNQVGGEKLLDIHVRGSSSKENINLN